MADAAIDRESTARRFAERFGRAAGVIARAPGRVNLIGEHTDYNEGLVLPIATEQSTWVACVARPDLSVRVASEALDELHTWRVDDWRRETSPHWTSYVAGVAALLRARGARLGGFEMLVRSDVPVGGGLSSSAALEVASAKALILLSGEALDTREVADLCRQAEHQFAGVPCGIMDQSISLLAQADTALLLDCRTRVHAYIPLQLGELAVVVVDSGVRHELAAGEYARRLAQCRAATEYFRKLDPRVSALRDVSPATVRAHASQMDPTLLARALHVTMENQRTAEAADAFARGDFTAAGRLMADSHRSLRDDYEVSCRELDALVRIASTTPGVIGARMTGGGFGGCIVALVRRDAIEPLAERVAREYGERARLVRTRPGRGASIEHG
ncbi:MAG: Galactokinase [Phycisphaerae bacterium]|nr:Galactokinase [Phycisphaerae bacterium]